MGLDRHGRVVQNLQDPAGGYAPVTRVEEGAGMLYSGSLGGRGRRNPGARGRAPAAIGCSIRGGSSGNRRWGWPPTCPRRGAACSTIRHFAAGGNGAASGLRPGLSLSERARADSVHVISQGTVRVLGTVETGIARHVRPGLCDLGDGEVFGELCLFDREPRSARVVALTDCERIMSQPAIPAIFPLPRSPGAWLMR